jgi:DNA-binding NarL/FixJ family response regulator
MSSTDEKQSAEFAADAKKNHESWGTVAVVIERRPLVRDCLNRCLKTGVFHTVHSYATVEDWLASDEKGPVSLIILSVGGRPREMGLRSELAMLPEVASHAPTVVMSDFEELEQIVSVLDMGARGYIPTSLTWDVAVEAIRLIRAGGLYVPASTLLASRLKNDGAQRPKSPGSGVFTARQAAVVEALRRGKANKTIAHELNMRESTVKVHVRNIMKKLRAKNRTEVAFMANTILATDQN